MIIPRMQYAFFAPLHYRRVLNALVPFYGFLALKARRKAINSPRQRNQTYSVTRAMIAVRAYTLENHKTSRFSVTVSIRTIIEPDDG